MHERSRAGAASGAPVTPPARLPRPLRPGDRVALVAPSGPVDPDALDRGRAVLAALGLEVVTGAHVLDRNGFLAGADGDRAADLAAAWCDPGVAAVVCARGGYGATRLLGLLDWAAMRAAGPKILIGSSDITALHRAFADRLRVATLFGPMPATRVLGGADGPDRPTLDRLRQALSGEPVRIEGTTVVVPGRAEGPLTGGNLTLLAALCGTPYALRARGRIVLLEDVGEQPYRIDRMLTQLLQAGCLDGALGFALGSWVGCGDALEVLAERLAPLGVPVLAGLPVGHGAPQFPVWLEAPAVLDTASRTLTSAAGPAGTPG
ncbi:S66 peptidase family protein [Thermobispora bispora]|uniref:Peptidase U61 LD-carboxypeptidase A n=1 Tax=Thermobispora bispora (strain ATCC 19993 / DSM 43833 / CBS 139.67 / JCM 10125 / KCTC 9307 / NBRC 14880 / R51) TaxID=469371 RepID=D6Y1R2_THEBD|nr:LD-carboxypeptidase [Thermobispora bispora]ADG88668.1 peptidase U61 LD-carboxypeptidase A [Thermobispora bispora DSM 43833]